MGDSFIFLLYNYIKTGTALGFSYAQTRNLMTPITIHAIWNSGVILLLTFLQVNILHDYALPQTYISTKFIEAILRALNYFTSHSQRFLLLVFAATRLWYKRAVAGILKYELIQSEAFGSIWHHFKMVSYYIMRWSEVYTIRGSSWKPKSARSAAPTTAQAAANWIFQPPTPPNPKNVNAMTYLSSCINIWRTSFNLA